VRVLVAGAAARNGLASNVESGRGAAQIRVGVPAAAAALVKMA